MTIKTAISIRPALLERIDRTARVLQLSRSALLARAAEKYLEELENRQTLAALDAVYAEEPTAEDLETERHMVALLRQASDG